MYPCRRYYRICDTSRVDESLFGARHREHDPWSQSHFPNFKQKETEYFRDWLAIKRWDNKGRNHVRSIGNQEIRLMNVPRLSESQGCSESRKLLLAPSRLCQLQRNAVTCNNEPCVNNPISHGKREPGCGMNATKPDNQALINVFSAIQPSHLTPTGAQEIGDEETAKVKTLAQNAIVQSIRDFQIMEKYNIAVQKQAEDNRLNQIMELERQNASKINDEIEKKRLGQNVYGGVDLIDQIYDNEQRKIILKEERDRDYSNLQQYLDYFYQEELDMMRNRNRNRNNYKAALDDCYARVKYREMCDKEYDRALSQYVTDYDTKRTEKLKEEEQLKLQNKIEKEKKIDKLRTAQQNHLDHLTNKIETRTRRDEERAEREYRNKEALQAAETLEAKRYLVEVLNHQVKSKHEEMARHLEQEKVYFGHLLSDIAEAEAEEKRYLNGTNTSQRKFCSDIVTQICEKEADELNDRKDWLKDGLTFDKESMQKDCIRRNLTEKTLMELRDRGVCENHLQFFNKKATKQELPQLFSAASLR